jgi:alpha-1,3/alpha-1,6-mannosyltransferase
VEDEHGAAVKKKAGLLKAMYRWPMDKLEEVTTKKADVILVNSNFTARVFKSQFPSIHVQPQVVHPGINIKAYEAPVNTSNPDILMIQS